MERHHKRRSPGPILMGQPSPSLARINRADARELTQKVERLNIEIQRLEVRIRNLTTHKPPIQRNLSNLHDQVKRLEVLRKLAQDKLAERQHTRTYSSPRLMQRRDIPR